MANRVFKSDLSVKGLRQLKKDLRNYQRQTLPNMLLEYVNRLADDGISLAKITSKGSSFSPYIGFFKEIKDNKYNYKVTAVIVGANTVPCFRQWFRNDELIEREVNALMLVEYGSGPHTDPAYYRGTFPRDDGQRSKGHNNVWFYATEKNADGKYNWIMTSGERALKPMREARDMVIRDAEKVAHRVFGW